MNKIYGCMDCYKRIEMDRVDDSTGRYENSDAEQDSGRRLLGDELKLYGRLMVLWIK